MKYTHTLAFALIPCLVIAPCGCSSAAGIADAPSQPAQAVSGNPSVMPPMIATPYAPSRPSEFANGNVAAVLKASSIRALSAREYGELAMGLAEAGKPDAAIVTANLGLGVATSNREKAALMATLALIWGSLKDYAHAAEAAQLGQVYLPDDPYLASLRLVYFDLAKDGVGALAASNHLMRLDPNFNRKPVFAIGPVIAGLEIGHKIYVAVTDFWERLTPEEKKTLHEVWDKMWVTGQTLFK